jgi:hypothetical protein
MTIDLDTIPNPPDATRSTLSSAQFVLSWSSSCQGWACGRVHQLWRTRPGFTGPSSSPRNRGADGTPTKESAPGTAQQWGAQHLWVGQ